MLFGCVTAKDALIKIQNCLDGLIRSETGRYVLMTSREKEEQQEGEEEEEEER